MEATIFWHRASIREGVVARASPFPRRRGCEHLAGAQPIRSAFVAFWEHRVLRDEGNVTGWNQEGDDPAERLGVTMLIPTSPTCTVRRPYRLQAGRVDWARADLTIDARAAAAAHSRAHGAHPYDQRARGRGAPRARHRGRLRGGHDAQPRRDARQHVRVHELPLVAAAAERGAPGLQRG